jgi:hypothetical protein
MMVVDSSACRSYWPDPISARIGNAVACFFLASLSDTKAEAGMAFDMITEKA